jgi:preprotein translocase subunit SecE
MIQQIVAFFRESYAELEKVTWLSRKEVVGSTVVIIILIGILSVFVALTDMFFAKLISWII